MKWEKFLSRKFLALVAVLLIIAVMLTTGKSVEEIQKMLELLWPLVGAYFAGNAVSKFAEKKEASK